MIPIICLLKCLQLVNLYKHSFHRYSLTFILSMNIPKCVEMATHDREANTQTGVQIVSVSLRMPLGASRR